MSSPFPIGGPLNVAANYDLTQNPGSLPDMNDALRSTFQLLTFEQVTKAVVNSYLVETTTPIQFYGSVNVLTPTSLDLAAHGQRAWTMKQVHAEITLKLSIDDVIIYQGTQYRVNGLGDYSAFGYCYYQLIQDFTGGGPVT